MGSVLDCFNYKIDSDDFEKEHGPYVSTLVHRIRRDKKEQKILEKYEIIQTI